MHGGNEAKPKGRDTSAPGAQGVAALAKNALAGLVASLLSIAYCLSFSALIFQGPLAPGLAQGLWCLLAGTAIAGLYVALTTSLPPVEAAPDNPAVAVLGVLALSVTGGVMANGGDGERAVLNVLAAFSIATFVTGSVLYGLGALRLGGAVRFIPYPVIGGFLAASGWFLVVGGIEIATARDLGLATLAEGAGAHDLLMSGLAAGFAGLVLVLKRTTGSTYVLPVAFLGGALAFDLALRLGDGGTWDRWYIGGTTKLVAWMPLPAVSGTGIDWPAILGAWPEIAAVAAVTVIALLLDVTGLEMARTRAADLDGEFRSNGVANIIAAPLGGVMGNLSLNGSRLLDETGGYQRISGVFAALVLVVILATGLDLTSLVPRPILAGLLIYLGVMVLAGVFLRSPAQQAPLDLGLALVIMTAIVAEGYLAGVVFGFIAACLMFAVRYSRIAVVRRHITRAEISSNVERDRDAARLLSDHGDRIHVFALAGYVFFGSSHRVIETVREAMLTRTVEAPAFAVLDIADVPGFDTAALLDLVKLERLCARKGVTLCIAGARQNVAEGLAAVGLYQAPHGAHAFASRDVALAWCEARVLADLGVDALASNQSGIESWLASELGSPALAGRILQYFEPRKAAAGTIVYAAGEAADSIDLVTNGTVRIWLSGSDETPRTLRTMSRCTVLGEMGFFRGGARAANVSAEENSALLTLTRAGYGRLTVEDPAAAHAFLELIVRILSDRLEFANRGLEALT